MIDKNMHKRLMWIDIGKAIAIQAVVLDHLLWTHINEYSRLLWIHTYFSVICFIFLAGVTASFSIDKKGHGTFFSVATSFWHNKLALIAYYIIATVIWIGILMPSEFWTLSVFIQKFMYFDVLQPYYFLFILFQLYALAPFLYALIHRMPNAIWKIFVAVLVYWIGTKAGLLSLLPHYGPPLYMFLGGPHLGIFTFGMVYISLEDRYKTLAQVVAIPLFIYCEWLICTNDGNGISSLPTVFHTSWVISGVLILHLTIDRTKHYFARFYALLSLIGKASVTIFLWHFQFVLWFMRTEKFNGVFILLPFLSIIGGLTLVHHIGIKLFPKYRTYGTSSTISQ